MGQAVERSTHGPVNRRYYTNEDKSYNKDTRYTDRIMQAHGPVCIFLSANENCGAILGEQNAAYPDVHIPCFCKAPCFLPDLG